MAAAKKTEAKTDGRIKVHLPRPAKGQADFITVGLNGKIYQIKKGEDVLVPRPVAEIIFNSELAKDDAYNFSEAKMAEANR